MTIWREFYDSIMKPDGPGMLMINRGEHVRIVLPVEDAHISGPNFHFGSIPDDIPVEKGEELCAEARDLQGVLNLPSVEHFTISFVVNGRKSLVIIGPHAKDNGAFGGLYFMRLSAGWEFIGRFDAGSVASPQDRLEESPPQIRPPGRAVIDSYDLIGGWAPYAVACLVLLHRRTQVETLLTLQTLPASGDHRRINAAREREGLPPVETTKVVDVSLDKLKDIKWVMPPSSGPGGHGSPKTGHVRQGYFRRPKGSPPDTPKTVKVKDTLVKGGPPPGTEIEVRLRKRVRDAEGEEV